MDSAKSVGDYNYDKFLGEGSFGKGSHKTTGEIVAIKCMDMAKLSDPYMLNSLKTEINVMKQLKSDNIVKLYDVISEPKTTYIILELCADGDLDKFVQKNGGMLKESVAIDVLKQLMHGFQELVSHNYIHRDIKPANALVKGTCFKVADFGFACEADIKGKILIQECVGTPLFMAPQLLENHPYGAKSDIWSIGMMFYMMIFGNTPWACRDLNSFLANIKRQPLKFPYDKPISQDCKDFITRSLTVNESQRIGWDEVFKHPLILESSYKQAEKPSVQFDEKSKKILAKLQRVIQDNHLNTKTIFDNFDKDHGGSLEKDEFLRMCAVVDPAITAGESYFIFKQIDQSGDGKINLAEFQKIIEGMCFENLDNRAGRLLCDLKQIIAANNINLQNIFAKYDADHGKSLDMNDFTSMIKILVPGFKAHEIETLFNKFDVNGDKTVTYAEFFNALNKGVVGKDSKYDPKGQKANKIRDTLKKVVKDNNLDVQAILNNFDKSQDGKLDETEFSKLVLVIDKEAQLDDIKTLFGYCSKNGKEITLMDFYEFVKN